MAKERDQLNEQAEQNLKQKQFNTPTLLHKIIRENKTLKEICNQYNLTFSQAANKIRTELNSIGK